jgi:tetratricopeptide (TPR) repeat protein
MKKYTITVLFVICTLSFFSQDDTFTEVTSESALAKVKLGNYEDALSDFLQLLNSDSRNELYNYNVGVCYLNSNINKAKAIPYLEQALSIKPDDKTCISALRTLYYKTGNEAKGKEMSERMKK